MLVASGATKASVLLFYRRLVTGTLARRKIDDGGSSGTHVAGVYIPLSYRQPSTDRFPDTLVVKAVR